MKNTIKIFGILVIVITTIFCAATADAQETIDFLMPAKTYHFDRNEVHRYAKNEGGNLGIIVSYSKNNRLFSNVYSLGFVRNSYGKPSVVGTFGKGANLTKWFRLELNAGIATNYKDAYYATGYVDYNNMDQGHSKYRRSDKDTQFVGVNNDLTKNMGFFYRNSIIPLAVLTAKTKITKNVGFAVILNPVYVNAGLMISLN